MTDQNNAPHVGPARARQGRWGLRVAWVLAVSTTLAGTAVFVVWAFRWSDLSHARTQPTLAEASQFHAPASSPKAVPTPPQE